MEKGKLIVVDGPEGAGKSTLLSYLVETLPANTVIFTREPGGTQISEKIRELLKSDVCEDANALTNFLLFWAARSDLVEKIIFPAVNRGVSVVTDRYDMSTFAYQICGQENRQLGPLFIQLREMFDDLVQPHLYIYLDVDPDEGARRIESAMSSAEGRAQDHFDRRNSDFHDRVRSGYFEFAENYPVKVIDANRPFSEVQEEFVETVREALASKPALS